MNTRQSYSPSSKSPVNNTGRKTPSKKSSSSSSKSIGLEVDKNTSAGVRRIENGFIVSESGYEGKGKNQKWVNKEYFSPTNPLAGVKATVKFGKK